MTLPKANPISVTAEIPIERFNLERFWQKVIPEPNSGCWLWTAAVDRRGYGVFGTRDGSTWLAHRVSYTALIGPITPGKILCHRCDVPSCVNPDHLFPGTMRDNTADAKRKGRTRSKYSGVTHCIHGHELTEENIYRYPTKRGGWMRVCRTCRKRTHERVKKEKMQRRLAHAS